MDNQLIVAFASIVLGAVLGGGGALVVLRSIVAKVKQEPLALDYIEKLYSSISPETLRDLLREIFVIGEQVTDGEPNTPPVSG